jgi:hypothetical protein
MSQATPAAAHRIDYPSLDQLILFRLKATCFQLQRTWNNQWHSSIHRYSPTPTSTEYPIIASSRTPLWTSEDAQENPLIVGKIQNLRVALQSLNGIEIPKDGLFSFWTQLGRPTAGKGYVAGRELRQGCLIPSVGGGLCQLSNALYSIALDADFEVIERHAHSQIVPGSLAEVGRDATVFWNYVDFRFQVPAATRIEAFLTATELVVQARSVQTVQPQFAQPQPIAQERPQVDATHRCESCNVAACFRSIPTHTTKRSISRTTYLVDEYWPEFDQYIQSQRGEADQLLLPLAGKSWKKANYAWSTEGFSTIKAATWLTLKRSLSSRGLPLQGRFRQQQLLKDSQRLAEQYAQWVAYDATHIVVMQNLLPFLWEAGILGGRTFDVLMTRLPLSTLQQRLDRVGQCYPESRTLVDFRADPNLLALEQQALKAARQLITPHTDVAQQYPYKTIQLNWHLPNVQERLTPGRTILFPASTLGRKGAYELRDVLRNLNLPLAVLGTELEGDRFWEGIPVQKVQGNIFQDVGVVVLPAHIEHRPSLLLRAIAQGVSVIASDACGLQSIPGVTTIPAGDIPALAAALTSWMTPFSPEETEKAVSELA